MPLEPELDKVISLTQCLRDTVFSNLVVKLSCLIPSSVINLQSFKQQEATQKDLEQTLTNTHNSENILIKTNKQQKNKKHKITKNKQTNQKKETQNMDLWSLTLHKCSSSILNI